MIARGETDAGLRTVPLPIFTSAGLLCVPSGADPDYEAVVDLSTGLTLTFQHNLDTPIAATGTFTIDANGDNEYTFSPAEIAIGLSLGTVAVIGVKTGCRTQVTRVGFGLDGITPGELVADKRRIYFGLFTSDGRISSGGSDPAWDAPLITTGGGVTIQYQHNLDALVTADGPITHNAYGEWYYDPSDAETASSKSVGTIAAVVSKTGYRTQVAGVVFGAPVAVSSETFTLGVTLAAVQLAARMFEGETFAIDGVYATATNTLHVELGFVPTAESEFDDGDALNPASWVIAVPSTGTTYTTIGVLMVDSTTFDITVLEMLGDHFTDHSVTATLLASDGSPFSPVAATFLGTVETIDPIESVSLDRYLDRDLANPPFQADADGFAGTLQIGANGDYVSDSGVDLVKKLVMRRLSTPLGGFPHLPGYGVGLAIKEPIIGSGNLATLKTTIQTQIRLEPDVENVLVGLTLDRSNTLLIQLRIRVAGHGAGFDMQMQAGNGQLVEL